MISFPTTLNSGGNNISLNTTSSKRPKDIVNTITSSISSAVTNSISSLVLTTNGPVDTTRLPYDLTRDVSLIGKNIFNDTYNGIYPSLLGNHEINKRKKTGIESNPLLIDPKLYSMFNTYRYVYNHGVMVPSDITSEDDKGNVEAFYFTEYDKKTLVPSLFNPYYGIQCIGPTKNTPLRDDYASTSLKAAHTKYGEISTDFTDCSIKTLCELSKQKQSELGQARYKYSDFMYCKNLGMPNNRMITLRRFSMPVGDIIMGPATAQESSGKNQNQIPGDIGRLITYFDTDDNKLEDILNYSVKATWKEMKSEIDQQDSQEDSRQSLLGMTLNTMSANYRQAYIDSRTGGNNILDYVMGKQTWVPNSKSWYENNKIFTNYDQHKIYEPINTMRSMHMYEGDLQFSNEFTLTFNYTLRSYDGINPKAAMLDLLSNILAVTYRRGRFWGGRQQINGPQPNIAGWKKANAIIDQKWDKLGGFFSNLIDSGFDVKGLFGHLANFFKGAWGKVKETANAITGTVTAVTTKEENRTSEQEKKVSAVKKFGSSLMDMGKAKLKNTLGRPQLYAFNSLLSGDNTGLWHVTIGNPRNPIAVMGNMIITDTKITQYGPLGIDDFPTGIKVQVSLKHSRPRDSVDIQKMYTRGFGSIYINMDNPQIPDATGKEKVSVNKNLYAAVQAAKNDTTANTDHLPDNIHYVVGEENPTKYGASLMYLGDYDKQRIRRNVNEIK